MTRSALVGVATVQFALISLLGISPAQAAECPAAGARYVSNNYVRISKLTSLGGKMDPTLGCQWRRDEDGKILWLDLGPTMKPLNEAAKPADLARSAASAGSVASSGVLPRGVYECDMPMNVGGMTMGTPATGPMFGVTGGNSYRDFNGGTGSFAVNGNILSMTSGPLRGTRYRRDGATLFRPLNAAGNVGSISCRLNKSKPLTGRW